MVEGNRKLRLAIIGASFGQLAICKKAVELGYETHCFSWPNGAVCRDVVDFFYPISILERDIIVEKCRELQIDGVVSNASEITAEVAAYVSEKLGLNGVPFSLLNQLHDKYYIRQLTDSVEGLSKPIFYKYEGVDKGLYPCVIKPCCGSAKKGVSFAADEKEFLNALKYAQDSLCGDLIVEEFIEGRELSVECISYKGEHQVIQVTDKDSSPAPHFVELGHHQPAQISCSLRSKIESVIINLLIIIGYTDGASHVEVRCTDRDEIYLVEVNLRGGGDEISNKLVQMSSGVDYLRCMIEVALDIYNGPIRVSDPSYSGIYYLCEQTRDYLQFFKNAEKKEWYVEGKINNEKLRDSHSNYERDGYIIYQASRKICPLTD